MNSPKRDKPAIRAKELKKVYKLYSSVADQAIDLMGLNRLFFWRKINAAPFPALDGLDVVISHGERVGIVGQNGAGKTTFLKLITGAISPTEGELEIDGEIQALMQVGLGFHPEFTGRENISASMLYSGLSRSEKLAAEQDIMDFCELGQFLDQPLKTYSLGMKSRLQFACATAIKPDILIIDEIMGAGDAYFSLKSSARMEKLTKSGCTLLLVSHSMGQILQFCERAIWIADGKVCVDGPALEVVKAYEKWMHEKSLDAGLLGERRSDNVTPDKNPMSVKGLIEPNTDVNEINFKESRWKSDDAPIIIQRVFLTDKSGKNSVFEPDSNVQVNVEMRATRTGLISISTAVRIYAGGGESVFWAGSPQESIDATEGDVYVTKLSLTPLHINSGKYTISVALFDKINRVNKSASKRYDLVSRCSEFAILDAHDGNDALYRHPAKWSGIESVKRV